VEIVLYMVLIVNQVFGLIKNEAMKTKKNFLLLILLTAFMFSCTEAFIIEQNDFESALVVEATITDELKFQEIQVSRAYKLTEEENIPVTNAIIQVKGENNTTFDFVESPLGTYTSVNKFSAQKNINYQLFITTKSGETFESELAKTSSQSVLNGIQVEINKSLTGEDEFRMYADSYDPTGKSKYYRYTYEETYKIVAPYWSPLKAVPISATEAIIVPKTDLNQRICYVTKNSVGIIQTETSNLSEDKVLFALRRISASDFSISHRYSIFVKQYVQSYEAYNYYKNLNKFSNSSSLLSQVQPGFFSGNVYSTSNKNSKVIGFFEVTSVSSKRIFFNYRDFIAIGRPKYIEKCSFYAYTDIIPTGTLGPSEMVMALGGGFLYVATNFTRTEAAPGPYFLVPKGCGDCTVYGSNIKPSFWID